VLATLRSVLDGDGRLICVFGCGGERDAGKRSLMGVVATRLADCVFVTSDNPRGEDPRAIIEQVIARAHPNYRVEVDRAAAIYLALREARTEDVVLLAGKGHEAYQEIAGARVPFSDAEVAASVLEQRR